MRQHSLSLGRGLTLSAAFPDLEGSVEITIARRRRVLFRKVFKPDEPRDGFRHHGRFVRADGDLELDVFSGELFWEGHLEVRRPWGRKWHRILGVDRGVIMRSAPAIGEIAGSPNVEDPRVSDRRFGESRLCTPTALRLYVDDQERDIADIGRRVKRRMFPDYPPFVFNTVACVGGSPEGAPGLYTNPNSIWFNVFFGYYQLDAPKPAWSRPFGYRSADGVDSEIEVDDILRLGKSDWNWFSNWMYGVPTEHVEPYNSIEAERGGVELSPPRRIGSSLWHGMTMRGIEVASAYESDAPGAARLAANTIVDDVWRAAFGLPNPQPDWPQSFVPTALEGHLDLCYREDDAAFHTLIFGGTAPVGADPAFLEAQLAAVRAVIERRYPDAGFGVEAGAPS